MRRLFPKITVTILLGIVFLLGGVGTASAGDQTSALTSTTSYVFQVGGNNSPNYATLAECTTAQSAAKTSSNNPNSITTCVPTSNAFFQQTDTGPAELTGFSCGIIYPSNLTACLPVGTYYLIYKPASYLLRGAGFLFDTILGLSISKAFVDKPFIDSSWTVMRDFSNMLFIFILLYTGVSTMLGAKDWRGVVLKVIIVALLINFSLFFTKVVIDAGNILAVGVYDAVKPSNNASFSGALVKAFEPQKFLDTAGKVPKAADAIVVFLVATIINGYAGYIFFKAALLFLGRLIAFWFLMIVSPFAFISTAFPKGNVFLKWWDILLNQAFVAPVYLFLLYLIMQVINVPGGIMKGLVPEGGSWFESLLAPIIMATVLLVAMSKSLELATSMAGEFGALGAKMAGTVMGVAGGAALGATALGGRAIGGRIAQGLQEKGTFQKLATSDSAIGRFAGRQLLGMNEKARTGTWDVRGAEGFIGKNISKGIKATGLDVGKVGAGAKGGFEGAQKRQDETDRKFAKKLEMTEDEKGLINAKYDVPAKEVEEKKHKQNVTEHAGRVVTAEKNKNDAETSAQNSEAGQALAGAQTQLKTQTDAAQKATVEVATAQKTLETAIDKVGAQKTLDEAVVKEAQALGAVKSAQKVVDETTAKYSADTQKEQQAIKDASQALTTAQKDLSDAQKNAQVAIEKATGARTGATKEIESENNRRRESYAGYVESVPRRVMSGASPAYSHKQAQRTAEKIRKGETETKEEKEQKAFEKGLKKMMADQAKKDKESSTDEPK